MRFSCQVIAAGKTSPPERWSWRQPFPFGFRPLSESSLDTTSRTFRICSVALSAAQSVVSPQVLQDRGNMKTNIKAISSIGHHFVAPWAASWLLAAQRRNSIFFFSPVLATAPSAITLVYQIACTCCRYLITSGCLEDMTLQFKRPRLAQCRVSRG